MSLRSLPAQKEVLFTHLRKTYAHSLKPSELSAVAYFARSLVASITAINTCYRKLSSLVMLHGRVKDVNATGVYFMRNKTGAMTSARPSFCN